MFDVFLKFLLLMPHLAQNLDLTPWGRPINIPPFVPNVIIPPNVNAVPDNIIPNGQTLIIPPQRNGISGTLGNGTLENNITNGGAPETDENGQQTSPIQVPAAQQIPPPPETGPPPLGPFQRLVPTIPYFFRPSNIQPTPTVGGYKYLHVCVGSKTRPKLCDIALQPQEEDNQIFHRINLLYNSERGRHRTFFSCMRLQRIERVKVHPFSNLTKKFQLLPWYYINILQVYHDFDAGPTELRHYLDHPQSGRGLKLYRDQFPLYHEQFTGPIDLVNPPEAFGIQLVECLSVWWIIIWSMVYLFGTLMFGVSWWFIKKDIQATFLATVIFASCGILITIGIVAKSFEVE
jgi:hypothetical protein